MLLQEYREGIIDACGTKATTFGCESCSLNKGGQPKGHSYPPTKPSTWQSHVHLEEAMPFSNFPQRAVVLCDPDSVQSRFAYLAEGRLRDCGQLWRLGLHMGYSGRSRDLLKST